MRERVCVCVIDRLYEREKGGVFKKGFMRERMRVCVYEIISERGRESVCWREKG
jgi:hypothetical protein